MKEELESLHSEKSKLFFDIEKEEIHSGDRRISIASIQKFIENGFDTYGEYKSLQDLLVRRTSSVPASGYLNNSTENSKEISLFSKSQSKLSMYSSNEKSEITNHSYEIEITKERSKTESIKRIDNKQFN